MRQILMRFTVFTLPVVGSGGAISVGLWKIGWPSDQFWKAHDHLIFAFIIAAGIVPVLQTTISEFGEKRRRTRLEQADNVRSLLVPALVYAVRHCEAPWDLTGVQAFLLTGWWWRERHLRFAKVRLASAPESGVAWTKGKGVIGQCWEHRANILVDLAGPPFSDLLNVPKEEWDNIPAETAYGLSHGDYQALGAKYGIVAAVPIIGGNGKYLGCVTLDMPPGHVLANTNDAMEFLATTADLVRRLLGR